MPLIVARRKREQELGGSSMSSSPRVGRGGCCWRTRAEGVCGEEGVPRPVATPPTPTPCSRPPPSESLHSPPPRWLLQLTPHLLAPTPKGKQPREPPTAPAPSPGHQHPERLGPGRWPPVLRAGLCLSHLGAWALPTLDAAPDRRLQWSGPGGSLPPSCSAAPAKAGERGDLQRPMCRPTQGQAASEV